MMRYQGATNEAQTVDLDPRLALERVDSWLDGFVRLLPSLIVALLVFGLFFVLAVIARRAVVAAAKARGRDNLGTNLGGFVKAATLVLGALLALTIVVPSIRAGDLIGGLGVSSVAIGFAFKDILQNWLAGMLLLFRQPFEIGDQIEVGGYTGTVEAIETRATLIKTFDGERIVIPNSDIYTSAVCVKTAFDQRRSEYDVGIGYADDIERACSVILEAMKKVDGVETDPPPQAFCWDLAASWVTLRTRWWTDSTRSDIVQVKSGVTMAIKQALDAARIDMPYDTMVQLVHDQTEAADGDRGAQREGWPLPADATATEPRWRAAAAAKSDGASS